MNNKTILILIASIAIPAAADAGDNRCRNYQPRPICRVVPRPVCRAPVYQQRQPTYSAQYRPTSQCYQPSRQYSSGYGGQTSSGSSGVSYRISTQSYTPPATNYGSSGLGGGMRIVQGSGSYVPHANGGHYSSSIRLVPY